MDIDSEIIGRIEKARNADPTVRLSDFQVTITADGYLLTSLSTGLSQVIFDLDTSEVSRRKRAA